MNKLIIACDPDVDGKGFALYKDGQLENLLAMPIILFYEFCKKINADGNSSLTELHIEDLCANKSSAFSHCRVDPPAVRYKKSESVGRCKQAQLEVEKIAEHFDIKIVRHRVSKKWKDVAGRKELERLTGWTGRSNPDTRSAAWFGYLGSR